MGRFKHVMAFGWLPHSKVWVTYDVGYDDTKITVIPAGNEAIIREWIKDCVLVEMKKNPVKRDVFPIIGWCAPSISRLLGLPVTLRCDALYRNCIANGGSLIEWD